LFSGYELAWIDKVAARSVHPPRVRCMPSLIGRAVERRWACGRCLVGVSLVASLLVVAAAVAAVLVGPLTKSAELVPADVPPGQLDVAAVAMSNGVLVAGRPTGGTVYLFTRAASGWSAGSEAAKLTPSDGKPGDVFGGAVAISGDSVIAGSGGYAGSKAVYVFVKPVGGWSGAVHERAKLTVRGRAVGALVAFAISGDTIAVGATDARVGANGGQRAVYVFMRPAGGWTGTVRPSAQLTASRGTGDDGLGQTVAISGADVFAGGSRGGYVFHRPRRGWRGIVHERARLVAPPWSSLAVSGTSVVAAGGALTSLRHSAPVFNRPARGWSGTVLPSARLKLYLPPSEPPLTVKVAADGDHIAALVYTPPDPHCGGPCGGLADLYSFDRPPSGWHGAIHAHTATSVMSSEEGLLATAGQAIATTDTTIAIYTYPRPG
jgi:hypothetical protein